MTRDSDELATRYRDDGYLVREILTMGEVDALRAEIAAVCRGDRGEVAGLTPLPKDTPDKEALGSVLCINHPHKVSPYIAERRAHPRIIDVLQQIIGPNVKCVNCVVFNRHPDELGLSWHQDEFYIPTRDRSLAQVWIALDATTREKACLRVIPGSHKPGILWPTRDRSDPDRFNDSVLETHGFPYTDDDVVFVEIPAGSAIFFNGYLLHGSLPYTAKTGSRRAITFGYMSAESLFPWDWNGMLEKTDDNRDITMVCGTDPYAYKGTQDRVHAWVDQRHLWPGSAVFEGFSETEIEADGVAIHVVHGGSGPPLLLLHGYPQMRVMWHKVAPQLAEDFTLVIPDLRGYGDSAKPESDASHLAYSKRASARDQVAVMRALGFETFAVAGHDRGARVGHRMALDSPQSVSKLAVLDIVPTHKILSTVDKHVARHYFLWFFLSQPADFPESIIAADPERYLKTCLGTFSAEPAMFSAAAMAEYVRCMRDPETIHATCEDYRAAASVDLEHDDADLGSKIACPVFALWSAVRGAGQAPHDVMSAWRERADDVRGETLDCGHFMPEEAPADTAAALSAFFQ